MSKCIDCGGGTPAPLWKRCYEHAMQRLRFVMSDGQVTTGVPTRKYARNDQVFVNGEIQRPGVVIRVRDTQYTVRLDNGRRCYVYASDLRDLRDPNPAS